MCGDIFTGPALKEVYCHFLGGARKDQGRQCTNVQGAAMGGDVIL